MENLHGRSFIHYTTHSASLFEIDQFFRNPQLEPRVVAEADDVYVIRDAIGAGVVPRSLLGETNDPEQFRVLASLHRKFEIYALFHKKDTTEEVLTALEILAGQDPREFC